MAAATCEFAPFLNGQTCNQTQQFGSNGLELLLVTVPGAGLMKIGLVFPQALLAYNLLLGLAWDEKSNVLDHRYLKPLPAGRD